MWAHARRAYEWIGAYAGDTFHNADQEALRVIKIMEESGEAAQALIGVRGQNPRKGVTHTNADLAAELADVVVSAMVAMHDHVSDPEAFFAEYIKARGSRLT